MSENRRNFIGKLFAISAYTAATAAGFISPMVHAAWPRDKFTEAKLEQILRKLFGAKEILASENITLKLPSIAENGAVVPVTVSSDLPNIDAISILVEKNPVPLAAQYTLSTEMEAYVSARLKMAETCNVLAIVRSDGKLFKVSKTVKVTIGGCGG